MIEPTSLENTVSPAKLLLPSPRPASSRGASQGLTIETSTMKDTFEGSSESGDEDDDADNDNDDDDDNDDAQSHGYIDSCWACGSELSVHMHLFSILCLSPHLTFPCSTPLGYDLSSNVHTVEFQIKHQSIASLRKNALPTHRNGKVDMGEAFEEVSALGLTYHVEAYILNASIL